MEAFEIDNVPKFFFSPEQLMQQWNKDDDGDQSSGKLFAVLMAQNALVDTKQGHYQKNLCCSRS